MLTSTLRYQLFKVKKDKLPMLKAWALELKRREEEVRETLKYENVSRELFKLFPVGEDWYAVGLQTLSGEHKKADMSVELNRKHFEILKDCLEDIASESLYDFCT